MCALAEPPQEYRSFASVCDVCLLEVTGRVERQCQDVFLVRDCPTHGARRFLVSRNGAAFDRYDRFRHATLADDTRPVDVSKSFFFITPACNQGCTYCLNEANAYAYFDAYDLDRFDADVGALAGDNVSLVGGEPFSHPRFFDFVRIVRRHGKKLLVFTNGLALADERLAARLLEESGGRCEVYMTFDGFAPELYEHVAAGGVRERKLAALANLEKHGIPTGLHHTIPPECQRGPRVDQAAALQALIAYAMAHDFVRALAFQPVVAIGGARHLSADEVCSVDRAMDQILAALPVHIERGEVYVLQKLFGLVSGLLRMPRCPHMQVVVLFRRGERWTGIDPFVDCAALDRRLDARLHRQPLTRARMLRALVVDVLACVRWRQLPALLRLAWQVLPVFLRKLDISKIPRTMLPIVSTTVCDRFNYDDTLARRCDKLVHTNVRGRVIAELASAMSLRQLQERAAHDAATGRTWAEPTQQGIPRTRHVDRAAGA
jgi:pyruvate-formate lyase-activating enzyme